MIVSTEELLKLVLAVLIGGAIGLERELRDKSAGFRTLTLICIGSTLITLLDIRLNASGRIAANIVTGIGFLGAGVILHEEIRVRGLTTAALVWAVAGLGIGIGAGHYLYTLIASAVVLVVMTLFNRLEDRITERHDRRAYLISFEPGSKENEIEQVEQLLRTCSLKIGSNQRMKKDGKISYTLNVVGTTRNQEHFLDLALKKPEIREIQW